MRRKAATQLILDALLERRCVSARTEVGEWLFVCELDIPLLWSCRPDVQLLHRHQPMDTYHFQRQSAWRTRRGVSDLLSYCEKHDFQYLNSSIPQVHFEELSVLHVLRSLPFDQMIAQFDEWTWDDDFELSDSDVDRMFGVILQNRRLLDGDVLARVDALRNKIESLVVKHSA